MPLSDTIVLDNDDRTLRCPTCGAVARWTLSPIDSVDLRDTTGDVADDVIDLNEYDEADRNSSPDIG